MNRLCVASSMSGVGRVLSGLVVSTMVLAPTLGSGDPLVYPDHTGPVNMGRFAW